MTESVVVEPVKVNASPTHTCPRCNGRGGWEGWPGFTCYLCGGEGTRPGRARKSRAKAKQVRTDVCEHCGETKSSNRWFIMKGKELWCAQCFDEFRSGQTS